MNSAREADPPFKVRNLQYRRSTFVLLGRPLEEFFKKMSGFTARTTDFWTHLRSDFMAQDDYYKSAWFRKANHHRTKYVDGSSWHTRLDCQPKSCIWVLNEKGAS